MDVALAHPWNIAVHADEAELLSGRSYLCANATCRARAILKPENARQRAHFAHAAGEGPDCRFRVNSNSGSAFVELPQRSEAWVLQFMERLGIGRQFPKGSQEEWAGLDQLAVTQAFLMNRALQSGHPKLPSTLPGQNLAGRLVEADFLLPLRMLLVEFSAALKRSGYLRDLQISHETVMCALFTLCDRLEAQAISAEHRVFPHGHGHFAMPRAMELPNGSIEYDPSLGRFTCGGAVYRQCANSSGLRMRLSSSRQMSFRVLAVISTEREPNCTEQSLTVTRNPTALTARRGELLLILPGSNATGLGAVRPSLLTVLPTGAHEPPPTGDDRARRILGDESCRFARSLKELEVGAVRLDGVTDLLKAIARTSTRCRKQPKPKRKPGPREKPGRAAREQAPEKSSRRDRLTPIRKERAESPRNSKKRKRTARTGADGRTEPNARRDRDAPRSSIGRVTFNPSLSGELCRRCGRRFQPEGWDGQRDSYCSVDCYLRDGHFLGEEP